MFETVKDLFDSVREAAGGIEELELQERWPDSRLWRYYRSFLHDLSGRCKVAGQSTTYYRHEDSGDDNFITLTSVDRATLRVFWASTGEYEELVPILEVQAWTADLQPPLAAESGTPTSYYLDTSTPTAPVIYLSPTPDQDLAWSVYILGRATPVLTEPTWGDDGMLQQGDWTIAAQFPPAFGRAALEHILYWVKRSGEEWTDERDEYQRKIMAGVFLEGLREFNSFFPALKFRQMPRMRRLV